MDDELVTEKEPGNENERKEEEKKNGLEKYFQGCFHKQNIMKKQTKKDRDFS